MFHSWGLMPAISDKLEAIEAQLLAEGGFFELEQATLLGTECRQFKNRARCLRDYLIAARAWPDASYLVFSDGSQERTLTFGEHERWVAATADVLKNKYGIKAGDRVAICAANCPEWVVTFWATVSLGAIAVGLNGWWTGDEIKFALDDCEPSLLVIDTKRAARLTTDPDVETIEIESEFASTFPTDSDATLPDQPIDPEDPAIILYTSGTTGRPKGVVHVHGNVTNMVGVSFFHGARLSLLSDPAPAAPPPQATVLVTSPLFHVSGLHCAAITALAGGAKTVWPVGRFDPALVLRLVEAHKVTGWGYTSTMLHRVVNHPDAQHADLSSFKMLGGGGSSIPDALHERTRALVPQCKNTMGVGYGLTEGTAFGTLNPGLELIEHADSVGRPAPIVDVEVRDASGNRVPDGTIGQIHLRGPLVMKEYWRNPEATAEVIKAGRWLNTGDIGKWIDGRLYLASRERDMIIRGGENVYPAEIELRLQAHPEVQEAAVVAVDSEEYGQQVKAIIVPVNSHTPSEQALTTWVSETLAYYKVPSHWQFRLEPLPRNATGKVLKDVLINPSHTRFIPE